MNFRNPTVADNFTSLATLSAADASSSSPTSQRPPKASTPLATLLGASAHSEMSAAEVTTPPCVLGITGDTQAIRISKLGTNTGKNYTCTLVTFMFWSFENHPDSLVCIEVLQRVHKMDIQFPRAKDSKNRTQFRKKCAIFFGDDKDQEGSTNMA